MIALRRGRAAAVVGAINAAAALGAEGWQACDPHLSNWGVDTSGAAAAGNRRVPLLDVDGLYNASELAALAHARACTSDSGCWIRSCAGRCSLVSRRCEPPGQRAGLHATCRTLLQLGRDALFLRHEAGGEYGEALNSRITEPGERAHSASSFARLLALREVCLRVENDGALRTAGCS